MNGYANCGVSIQNYNLALKRNYLKQYEATQKRLYTMIPFIKYLEKAK